MKKILLALVLAALPALARPQSIYSSWTKNHAPGAAANATIAAAATTGVRHVATSATVCVAAAATAQTPLQFVLRDGATGAGTVIWTMRLAAPANSSACITTPMVLVGTSGTAMTLETAAAPAAGAFAVVSLTGYDTHN